DGAASRQQRGKRRVRNVQDRRSVGARLGLAGDGEAQQGSIGEMPGDDGTPPGGGQSLREQSIGRTSRRQHAVDARARVGSDELQQHRPIGRSRGGELRQEGPPGGGGG